MPIFGNNKTPANAGVLCSFYFIILKGGMKYIQRNFTKYKNVLCIFYDYYFIFFYYSYQF